MRKIIWFIGCFFLMLNSTWAVTLSCPEIVSPGEVISCQVEEEEYIGMKAKYQVDEGLVYQQMQINSNFKSYYSGIDGFSVGNVGSVDHLSLTVMIKVGMDVMVNQDYSVGLVDIEGCSADYKYVKLEDVHTKVRVVSDDNTLDKLIISDGKLVPDFNKNITQYQAEVNNDKVTIEGVATDSNAKVEGDIGQQHLHYGANKFVVRVISVKGNIREYVLYITRPIVVNNHGSGNSSGNSSDMRGENSTKSSDVTLKSLSLSTGKIAFKSNTFLYSVKVSYDVEDISIKAVPNSDKAKIEIEKPDKLAVGDNTIQVHVIAEDGSVGTYIIVIRREEKKSNVASIKTITIKGYDFKIQSHKFQYDLEINDEDKLDIRVELNDSKATYKIIGNNNLKNNSQIEIVVTAEDGTYQKYQIHIIKLGEANSSSIIDRVSILSLVGFVLFVLVILFVKRMKNKVEKKSNE